MIHSWNGQTSSNSTCLVSKAPSLHLTRSAVPTLSVASTQHNRLWSGQHECMPTQSPHSRYSRSNSSSKPMVHASTELDQTHAKQQSHCKYKATRRHAVNGQGTVKTTTRKVRLAAPHPSSHKRVQDHCTRCTKLPTTTPVQDPSPSPKLASQAMFGLLYH